MIRCWRGWMRRWWQGCCVASGREVLLEARSVNEALALLGLEG